MDNRKWLEERFLSPVVIVAASPDCEEVCAKNGLDFFQLLKPFQQCTHVVTAYTGKDASQHHRVKDFGVRFFRPDNLNEMSPRMRVDYFQGVMREHGAAEVANGAQLNEVLERMCSSTNPNSPILDPRSGKALVERTFTAWHDTFIRDYVHVVRCSYFDTLDHPAGFLFGVSTAGGPEAVIARINELASVRAAFFAKMEIPPMDQEAHHFIVLVHDCSQEPQPSPTEVQVIFDIVAKSVGQQTCALININSNRQSGGQVSSQRWIAANRRVDCYSTVGDPNSVLAAHRLPKPSDPALVSHLTHQDIVEIQNTLNRYYEGLVSWIAKKIVLLMDSVEKKRTTTFSKVAAWFKSDADKDKGKGEPKLVSVGRLNAPRYVASAVEIQMRRCGDLFMCLRDFDSAVKYFRLAREELRNTLAERKFNDHLIAAAQEAIAICHYFQGKLTLPGGPREGECRLDEARKEYLAAKVQSYAFRTALMLIALCRNRTAPENGRALLVATSALRAGDLYRNRTYAAVLHEICANCLLVANPPMAGNSPDLAVSVASQYRFVCHVRKHSRFMAMAGSAYAEIGAFEQALKCFVRALTIQTHLGGTTWRALMEHIIDSLSSIYQQTNQPVRSLGMRSVAVRDGMPRFKGPHALMQVSDFMAQIKSFLSNVRLDFVPHMMLPRARATKIAVSVNTFGEDDVTLEESVLVAEAAESEWREMEDKLRGYLAAVKSPVSLPFKRKRDPAGRARQVEGYHTLVDEVCTIRVPLSNSTAASLTLENVCLIYRAYAHGKQQASASTLLFADAVPSLMMSGEASIVAMLPFRTTEPGIYEIVGIAWQFLEVPCRLYFANTMTEQHGICKLLAQVNTFEHAVEHPEPPAVSSAHIKMVVDGSAAGLRMAFDPPLPQRARDGFVYRGVLRLTNSSATCSAHSIAISRSKNNAHLLYFSSFTPAENADFSSPLSLGDLTVPPRGTLELRVTYRAQYDPTLVGAGHPGAHGLCSNYIPLLLSYASEHHGDIFPTGVASSVRLHKLLRRVQVGPSVSLASVVMPPLVGSGLRAEFAAELLVSNLSGRIEAPLRIVRCVATATGWDLQPINTTAIVEDDAVACFLTYKQRLAIPLRVSRGSPAGREVLKGEAADLPILDPIAVLRDRAPEVGACVGRSVCDNDEALFFIKYALRAGCGKLGVDDEVVGEWAFFADGAGGKPIGEDAELLAESERRARQLRNMCHFSPVLLSVVWAANENGVMAFGQVFSFIDVLGVQRHSAIADWRPRTLLESSALHGAPAGVGAAPVIDAFFRRQSVVPARGIVACTSTFPPRVEFPPVSCAPIVFTVTLHLTSFAGEAIVADVNAKPGTPSPACPHPSLAFVGRTRVKIVLPPEQCQSLEFRVLVVAPGMYDLNQFEITATPFKRDAAAARPLIEHATVVGNGTPWTCFVGSLTAPVPRQSAAPTSQTLASRSSPSVGSGATAHGHGSPLAAASPEALRPIGRQRTTSLVKDPRPIFKRRQHSQTFASPGARRGGDLSSDSGGAALEASSTAPFFPRREASVSPAPSNSLLATLAAFQKLQQQGKQVDDERRVGPLIESGADVTAGVGSDRLAEESSSEAAACGGGSDAGGEAGRDESDEVKPPLASTASSGDGRRDLNGQHLEFVVAPLVDDGFIGGADAYASSCSSEQQSLQSTRPSTPTQPDLRSPEDSDGAANVVADPDEGPGSQEGEERTTAATPRSGTVTGPAEQSSVDFVPSPGSGCAETTGPTVAAAAAVPELEAERRRATGVFDTDLDTSSSDAASSTTSPRQSPQGATHQVEAEECTGAVGAADEHLPQVRAGDPSDSSSSSSSSMDEDAPVPQQHPQQRKPRSPASSSSDGQGEGDAH